jgi:hypothetical protein
MSHARYRSALPLLDKKTEKKHRMDSMDHVNPSRVDKGSIPYHPCAVNTSEYKNLTVLKGAAHGHHDPNCFAFIYVVQRAETAIKQQ